LLTPHEYLSDSSDEIPKLGRLGGNCLAPKKNIHHYVANLLVGVGTES
jgi:hypothetical protein